MNTPGATRQMLDGLRGTLQQAEKDWNETVFAGHQQATPGILEACTKRSRWIRRYDFVRMAVEHRTLAEEKLHGGREIGDGKKASVDGRSLTRSSSQTGSPRRRGSDAGGGFPAPRLARHHGDAVSS